VPGTVENRPARSCTEATRNTFAMLSWPSETTWKRVLGVAAHNSAADQCSARHQSDAVTIARECNSWLEQVQLVRKVVVKTFVLAYGPQ